jgi:hypothetical protein
MAMIRDSRAPKRRGSLIIELFVAATLLAVLLLTVATQIISQRRAMIDVRHRQLAMDELSNKMNELLAHEDLSSMLPSEFEISPQLASVMPDASLHGERVEESVCGQRVVLTLKWNQHVPHSDLQLVGWSVRSNGVSKPADAESER